MAELIKSYENYFGLDLKSSDIVRPIQYASTMLNAQYRPNGNITKRPGYRTQTDSSGGAGLAVYNRINPETNLQEELLISIGESLELMRTSTITFEYTGSQVSTILEIFFDPDSAQYRVQIVEDTVTVLDFGLGVGIDEINPVTLADVKAAVDALPNFQATITGADTVPAAYMDLVRGASLLVVPFTSTARYFEAINTTATLFPSYSAQKDSDDFENTSTVQLNNVLFASNGFDEVIKYDGQTAYRAGLPNAATPSTVIAGGGSLTGTYRHSFFYTQFDAVGNIVEGQISGESSAISASSQDINVTVDNILAGSGFNTNCAIVTGAQSTVTTLNVDNGSGGTHTMQIGDTAYFFDNLSASYITRKVTGVTAASITIEGAPVSVSDNYVISNNLRISIYRNQNGGTLRFLVAELPNNSFASTQTFEDDLTDNALGIEFVDPLSRRDPPRKGKYLASYFNQLFVAGSLEDPNFAFWSAPENPEYFDEGLYNLRFQSPNGDRLSGLRQVNEVMAVFEPRAIHVITGDIAELQIRVETITKDIGCIANGSIQEVRGRLYFLSDRGIFRTVSGQLPENASERIEPIFDLDGTLTPEDTFRLKRAVAVNFRENEQYILFIPKESSTAGNKYANDSSEVFVEDYFRGAWLRWNNMNMAAGAVILNNQLFFSERRNSIAQGTVTNYLYSQSNRGDAWDYQDGLGPVNFSYGSAWYHMNEPSVFKKYLRLKIFGSQDTNFNAFDLEVDIEKDFIFDAIVGTFPLILGKEIDGYGISPYGTAPYGDVAQPSAKHKIGPIKAKSLRFIMKNSKILENIDLEGWELDYASAYRKEMKE